MKLSNPEFSNIRNHAKKCKYDIKYEDFKIIGRALNNHQLNILESLCIKQMVPQLNTQTTSSPLYLSWVSLHLTKTSEVTQSFPPLLTGTLCACSPFYITIYFNIFILFIYLLLCVLLLSVYMLLFLSLFTFFLLLFIFFCIVL